MQFCHRRNAANAAFPDANPYATAIAAGEADINRCPPGGEEGIHKLADLLGMEFKPFGEDTAAPKPKSVAVIDESTCIGCTLCIQACPVDAISGAAKQMHTIIEAECTGCELCVAPCPVDCISMIPIQENIVTWKFQYPASQNLASWIASSATKTASMSKPI